MVVQLSILFHSSLSKAYLPSSLMLLISCIKVDVVFKNSAKRTQMQAQEISAMLSSLAVSTSYEKGQVHNRVSEPSFQGR